jgi:hypothetical protein
MECKTGVLLGKAVFTQYRETQHVTYGFTALGHTFEDGWSPREEGCSELQHFLMLHRNHELRVLPETVERYSGDLGIPQSFPDDDKTTDPEYNRAAFFLRDTGKPDPVKEAEELPESLIKRLQEF